MSHPAPDSWLWANTAHLTLQDPTENSWENFPSPSASQSSTVSEDTDCDYMWEMPPRNAETIARYRPGGLHPVHLSDTYSRDNPSLDRGRYRILHKLGFGSFSHVWLAQDTELSDPTSRAVALKFIAASSTGQTNEVAMHEYLASRSPEDVGFQNILLALDIFQVNGPNGLHDIIVMDVVTFVFDLCKSEVIEDLNELEIIRQTLQGVAFLHKHGVVHRDLHCGNLAVEFPFFRTGGLRQLLRIHPMLFPCVSCDPGPHSPSVPNYIVTATPFSSNPDTMREQAKQLVVKITDFGCAFRPETADILVHDDGPPRWLRAPECIVFEDPSTDISPLVHVPWSFQSDIWTLGCSLVELYSRRPNQNPLFGGSGTPSLGSEMATLLGPVPDRYRQLLGVSSGLLDHTTDASEVQVFDGIISEASCGESNVAANWLLLEAHLSSVRIPKTSPNNTDEEQRATATGTKDVQTFLSLIRQMLRWDPKDRISADGALGSPLFQRT